MEAFFQRSPVGRFKLADFSSDAFMSQNVAVGLADLKVDAKPPVGLRFMCLILSM